MATPPYVIAGGYFPNGIHGLQTAQTITQPPTPEELFVKKNLLLFAEKVKDHPLLAVILEDEKTEAGATFQSVCSTKNRDISSILNTLINSTSLGTKLKQRKEELKQNLITELTSTMSTQETNPRKINTTVTNLKNSQTFQDMSHAIAQFESLIKNLYACDSDQPLNQTLVTDILTQLSTLTPAFTADYARNGNPAQRAIAIYLMERIGQKYNAATEIACLHELYHALTQDETANPRTRYPDPTTLTNILERIRTMPVSALRSLKTFPYNHQSMHTESMAPATVPFFQQLARKGIDKINQIQPQTINNVAIVDLSNEYDWYCKNERDEIDQYKRAEREQTEYEWQTTQPVFSGCIDNVANIIYSKLEALGSEEAQKLVDQIKDTNLAAHLIKIDHDNNPNLGLSEEPKLTEFQGRPPVVAPAAPHQFNQAEWNARRQALLELINEAEDIDKEKVKKMIRLLNGLLLPRKEDDSEKGETLFRNKATLNSELGRVGYQDIIGTDIGKRIIDYYRMLSEFRAKIGDGLRTLILRLTDIA